MPPPPPPADADAQRTQLEARLAAALIYCGRTYRRQVDRHLAAHQLSDARALPVMQISRAGNALRQRDLAELLGIEGPSLVRLLDQLAAAGLVERRASADDRRAKTLHLTPAGEALAEVAEDVLTHLRASLLASVSTPDLAATLRCLDALSGAFGGARAPAANSDHQGD